MNNNIGWDARKKTDLLSYDFGDIEIKVGNIYWDRIAITGIQKVEWRTRIKPTDKCVHMVKYFDLKSGEEKELSAELIYKYFIVKKEMEVDIHEAFER